MTLGFYVMLLNYVPGTFKYILKGKYICMYKRMSTHEPFKIKLQVHFAEKIRNSEYFFSLHEVEA